MIRVEIILAGASASEISARLISTVDLGGRETFSLYVIVPVTCAKTDSVDTSIVYLQMTGADQATPIRRLSQSRSVVIRDIP